MKLAYYGVAIPLAHLLFWRIGAVAEGIENIPRSGPVLFAGNHQKEGDGVLVLRGIPRRVRTLVKSDNESGIALFLLGLLADMIIIDRNSSDYGALREARYILKSSGALLMFPGAHRIREVIGFHPGVASLARCTDGVMIVPFGILHADHLGVSEVIRILFRGSKTKEKPTIRFGEPFKLPPAHLPSKQQREEDVATIRRRVLDLLPEDMEGENVLYVVERPANRR
ncbi:MAG: hypothetical protein A2Z11_02735 [Candidatus Woykebacteria bacterium RBG_16_43_9]|uniref:Phospholipid/glycerol acyltransferase domain-containing protein n=1 Tax=Candidatus Woykebacteria bacterium RBG_16_43_9 TaxID=1802596 RepID=A0A1G1WGW6_9BACT|nr:MAG: hypothetical protein A2Z11_02735 [Candidatus Woykebacteria bacterium RBG_16_43_9]